MKFTLSNVGASQSFSASGEGWVEINGARHTGSLILGNDRPPRDWNRTFEQLDAQDFAQLLDWQPEIVVFGSGRLFRFPHPGLTRALPEARIGLEVMDTRAACRTFNVLASEGRRVVAAILID